MQKQNNQSQNLPEKPNYKVSTNSGLRYLICTGIGLLMSFILALVAGIFLPYEKVIDKFSWQDATDLLVRMHILTDATFVSGVLIFSVGVLVVASNGGAFEMLVYGVRRFISLFQKDVNKIKFKTFYDYHVYKSSEPRHSFAYLLVVGAAFIAISGIFLAIYMTNR